MRESHLKILQYVTGIGIFFLVGLHLIISHLTSGEPTEASVVQQEAERLQTQQALANVLVTVNPAAQLLL